IEDLDRARCKPQFVEEIFFDLEYLGLGWDEEVVFQSRRQRAYDAAIGRLDAYRCVCSRAEIARAASAPHGLSEEGPRYPGTCRGKAISTEGAAAIRFQVPPGVVELDDLV